MHTNNAGGVRGGYNIVSKGVHSVSLSRNPVQEKLIKPPKQHAEMAPCDIFSSAATNSLITLLTF